MEALGTRMRGGLATMLSVALIMSGVLLAAPAANAEEVNSQGETAIVDVPAVEAPAEVPAPTPADDAPAQSPTEGGSVDAPEVEAPTVDAADEPAVAESVEGPSPANLLAAAVAPQLSVSKTTELDAAGEVVTVTGSGYNPEQQIYVFFCADTTLPADLWSLALGCRTGAKQIGQASSSSATKFNTDGTFTVDISVKQLNGAATSLYTSANHTAMTDRSQDAKVVLSFAAPAPVGPAGLVSVTAADESGVTFSAAMTGFDSSALPNGVYVGVIEAGTAETVTMSSIIGTAWVRSIAASGEVTQVVQAAASALDRSKSYEVLVWRGNSNPSAATNLLVLPAAVSAAQWDAVFPAKESINAAASVTTQGLKVDVTATDLPGGIYAALIERGTVADLDMSKPNSYAAFALPFPKVTDGAANFSLIAAMDKLDRKKQYEVVVWKLHSLPGEKTIYGQANVGVTAAQWDKLEGIEPPVEEPGVKPKPTAPGAGSLTWGISTPFANYVTGNISKGTVATSGVGGGRGGYVFPQATGSNWNTETRTGTVYFSGSVTFIGHGGLLRETFANPAITVNSPISGTISAGGQSFPLNLAGAGFTANSDGSATWSNVPVSGVISGGDGSGAGGALSVDSLTFTVGSASGLNFGSTTVTSKYAATRTAAATPPSATGLTVTTPAAKLVAGGEIEITAGGFEPNEQGILVVIYSEPTVLDTNAKADKDGVVRWIGKLPKELTGKHTITLQGSISVGQEITIAAADSLKKATKAGAAPAVSSEVQSTGSLPNTGTIAWVWWTGALALIVAAGATTGLVVMQRRKNAAADRL